MTGPADADARLLELVEAAAELCALQPRRAAGVVVAWGPWLVSTDRPRARRWSVLDLRDGAVYALRSTSAIALKAPVVEDADG